jgi:hypothetical protein
MPCGRTRPAGRKRPDRRSGVNRPGGHGRIVRRRVPAPAVPLDQGTARRAAAPMRSLYCLGPAGHLNRIFSDGSPEGGPDASNECLVALVRQRRPTSESWSEASAKDGIGKFRGEQRKRVFSLDKYLSMSPFLSRFPGLRVSVRSPVPPVDVRLARLQIGARNFLMRRDPGPICCLIG